MTSGYKKHNHFRLEQLLSWNSRMLLCWFWHTSQNSVSEMSLPCFNAHRILVALYNAILRSKIQTVTLILLKSFLLYMLWLLVCCSCGLPTVGVCVPLTLSPAPGALSLLLCCQPWCEGFCLVLLHLILSVCLLSLAGLFFSEEEMEVSRYGRGIVQRSWEEWREGKPWLGCIVREKNLFSTKIK